MSLKNLFLGALGSLALVGCIATNLPDSPPGNLHSELVLQELKIQGKDFLIVQIDPDFFHLQIVENPPKPASKSIHEIKNDYSAEMAFNGNFYDEDFRPLGLLISASRSVFPLNKSALMNGIFTIDNSNNPTLYTFDDFQKNQTKLLPKIDFAIQSGPILLDNTGQITINKGNTKKSGRTALAIDKNGDIVLIILRETIFNQNNSLTLYDFASIISTSNELSDLRLHSMINLDGGKSSGLAIQDQYFPEVEKVQNIIIVTKRS